MSSKVRRDKPAVSVNSPKFSSALTRLTIESKDKGKIKGKSKGKIKIKGKIKGKSKGKRVKST